MTEMERIIVAAIYAGSDTTWKEFSKRMATALVKLQKADQADNDAETEKGVEVWRRLRGA